MTIESKAIAALRAWKQAELQDMRELEEYESTGDSLAQSVATWNEATRLRDEVLAQASEPEPVFHLRSYGDVSNADIGHLAAPMRWPFPQATAQDAKDAARYRWLRERANRDVDIDIGAGIEISDTLDAAIDAAMKEQSNGSR